MERRLAAIVCADVAGYSRMMGADEAGTHAAFKAHRSAIYPIILNHGGRVVKNTGDGFLLEFPSIVGAIESAIAMQTLMAERNHHLPADRVMQFRMGVHMGDVISDEDEVFGDGVNIAVRLEAVASPGGVAVSAKAHGEAGKHLSVTLVDAGSHRSMSGPGSRAAPTEAAGSRGAPACRRNTVPRSWACFRLRISVTLPTNISPMASPRT
jgi:adenylate cyclase